jgi:hypothetical protein
VGGYGTDRVGLTIDHAPPTHDQNASFGRNFLFSSLFRCCKFPPTRVRVANRGLGIRGISRFGGALVLP